MEGKMFVTKGFAWAFALTALVVSGDALAYEQSATQAFPGQYFGTSAAMPPEGIYMFMRATTYQSNLDGPVTKAIGNNTGFQMGNGAAGAVFVPGWNFLGASYDAVIVQTVQMVSVGSPINSQSAGVHNTYISPGELSWKFGDSGFYVKAGFGMYVPDGTQTGANGLGNAGAPYWTFVPNLTLSYFKNGWNLSGTFYQEFNTANRITGYRSGDVFHAEFTATKKIDRVTFGPVALYVGQVTDDKSSAFYGNRIQSANRHDRVAVGALVGYDFGPASLTAWAAKDVWVTASGSTRGGPVDLSTNTNGWTALVGLNFRVWAPENDKPKVGLITK